jgi:hypothetical protein
MTQKQREKINNAKKAIFVVSTHNATSNNNKKARSLFPKFAHVRHREKMIKFRHKGITACREIVLLHNCGKLTKNG